MDEFFASKQPDVGNGGEVKVRLIEEKLHRIASINVCFEGTY